MVTKSFSLTKLPPLPDNVGLIIKGNEKDVIHMWQVSQSLKVGKREGVLDISQRAAQ